MKTTTRKRISTKRPSLSSTKAKRLAESTSSNEPRSLGYDLFQAFKRKIQNDASKSTDNADKWWTYISSHLKHLGDVFVVRFMAPIVDSISKLDQSSIVPNVLPVAGMHHYREPQACYKQPQVCYKQPQACYEESEKTNDPSKKTSFYTFPSASIDPGKIKAVELEVPTCSQIPTLYLKDKKPDRKRRSKISNMPELP